jgi:hypothetical protein
VCPNDQNVEQLQRARLAEINSEPGQRLELEIKHGRVWDTAELAEEFQVTGFMAPYVVVTRKLDSKIGSLEFQHSPRYYFNWKEDIR